MPIKINHNIFSAIVQRNLNQTTGRLMQSFERLSTGERINRSADDPAGLATSDQIRYELRAVRKDQQNVSGAFGLVGTAESQLAAIGENIQRARELVVQGANDTLNVTDRQAIQEELDQIINEIDRIAGTVTYNELLLLNGTLQDVKIQIGTQSGETISLTLGDFQAPVLGARSHVTGSMPVGTDPIDANMLTLNGFAIPASVDDGVSTVNPTASALAKANAINSVSASTGVRAEVLATEVNGSSAITATFIDGTTNVLEINGIDISPVNLIANDASGALAKAINDASLQTGVTATVTSAGLLELRAEDGRNIFVDARGSVGQALGLSGAPGDITIEASGQLQLISNDTFSIVDSHAAGVLGIVPQSQQVNDDPGTALQFISVIDATAAADSLLTLDTALSEISKDRSKLGALNNRLESISDALARRVEDLSVSDSRIRDADFIFETARLSQLQILQDAALSMLTQANVTPRRALDLLRGG